jgi:hypothetical protein
MCQNPLVNIKFAAFAGLTGMTKLYIRNTTLTFVPNAALSRAKSLLLVDMSFNQIEALFDYGFPGELSFRYFKHNFSEFHILFTEQHWYC